MPKAYSMKADYKMRKGISQERRGKGAIGKHELRFKDNTHSGVNNDRIGCLSVDWIRVVKVRALCQTLVIALRILRFHNTYGVY
jgi:hypothetical protein